MDKIKKTLSWIDKRIENYLLLLTKIVRVHTNDEKKSKEAETLLRTALRTAFFLDFYSETNDKNFLQEANRYRELMYSSMPKKDRPDLESIERGIVKLFDYEKQIWARIKSGQKVSNEDIEKFWQMKSADASFYGRVTKIFTRDRDFTLPIYVYTQILDIGLDLREYEKDLQENSPNILYMKLSQALPLQQIPILKEDAIREAIRLGLKLDLERVVEKLSKQVSIFDFGECSFLKKAITHQRNILRKLLCVNNINVITKKIFPEYYPVKRVLINSPTRKSLSIINNKNYKKFLFRKPPKNIDGYIKEHLKLGRLLKENKIEVVNINSVPLAKNIKKIVNKNPNLIFTRDSVLILPYGAIILNMATTKRRTEPYIMKHILNELKIPILLEIPKNKKVEGGDLIFLNETTLLIGYGPRTSFEGINYLYEKLVLDLNVIKEIIAIKISPNRINLDGVLMPLGDNIILIDKNSIDSTAIRLTKHANTKINLYNYFKDKNMKLIEVNKKEGLLLATNVFNIGNKKLICYKHNRRVNNLLKKYGFKILKLDGRFLIKGSGGPRCMTNPIRYEEFNN